MEFKAKVREDALSGRAIAQWALVFAICIGLFLGSLQVRNSIWESDLRDRLQIERDSVLLEANAIRYRLEAEVLSTFYLVTGLATYIGTNPDMNAEEFERFAEAVHHAKPGLVNLAVAPDMVVRFVYPLEGNEAAMGLDYATHPTQRAAAFLVKESGKPVIAGPLELVQGGVAIVGRFPVYTKSGFWGIVSTPVYLKQLLLDSGMLDEGRPLEFALRGKDGKGERGDLFYGDSQFFNGEVVRVPVLLPAGTWELGARPMSGWATEAPNGSMIDMVVWMVCGLLVLIVVLLNGYMLRLVKGREMEASVSRAKSRFLATMSHEIRTPLNGICGVAQLLEYSELDDEQKELVTTIYGSATALSDLLTDILDLSRLESGNFKPIPEACRLQETTGPILKLLKPTADKKGIAIVMESIPPGCENVVIDPLVLRQILWNLLSNGVKFTSSGEVRVVFSLLSAGGGKKAVLRIKISDTGIGIAKDRQRAVFEDFVQEDDSTTRTHGGAGLGLAIVHRLVECVGGRITLESEKGRGSVFLVELPLG